MNYALKLKTAMDMSRDAERRIRNTTGLKISLIVSEHEEKTPEELIALVGGTLKLEKGFHRNKIRRADFVEGRHVAALLLQRYFPALSFTGIGRLFGQDHSTIIDAIKRSKNLLQTRDLRFTQKYITAQNTVEQWIND